MSARAGFDGRDPPREYGVKILDAIHVARVPGTPYRILTAHEAENHDQQRQTGSRRHVAADGMIRAMTASSVRTHEPGELNKRSARIVYAGANPDAPFAFQGARGCLSDNGAGFRFAR